jgi:hypothetical protein
MAYSVQARVGLADVLKGQVRWAQRDAEHAGRGIWVGSYVEP